MLLIKTLKSKILDSLVTHASARNYTVTENSSSQCNFFLIITKFFSNHMKKMKQDNWKLKLPDLKWIMKIDDDMMVNFTKLDNYLSKENINHEALHCPVNSGMPALRDYKSKW